MRRCLLRASQGVNINELLELSESVVKGEYKQYGRDAVSRQQFRKAKSDAIKQAKKEAKAAQVSSALPEMKSEAK